MARQIDSQETERNKEFDQLLDEMYYQYHYHPTNIPHFDNPKAESDGRFMAALADSHIGHGNDNNYCNGLPRGGRSTQVYTSDHASGEGIGGGACIFVFVFAATLIGLILITLYNV